MKLDGQKTRDELYDIGDIWYQRNIKVRDVFKDENKESKDRVRAFIITMELTNRCVEVFNAIKMIDAKSNIKFKPGGKTNDRP